MKKMKTTMAAAVALAACVGTELFAAGTDANDHQTNAPVGARTLAAGRLGPGSGGGAGYFNPLWSAQYNPYPYYNIIAGEAYGGLYQFNLPDQFESPFNPSAALTRHRMTAPRLDNARNRQGVGPRPRPDRAPVTVAPARPPPARDQSP